MFGPVSWGGAWCSQLQTIDYCPHFFLLRACFLNSALLQACRFEPMQQLQDFSQILSLYTVFVGICRRLLGPLCFLAGHVGFHPGFPLTFCNPAGDHLYWSTQADKPHLQTCCHLSSFLFAEESQGREILVSLGRASSEHASPLSTSRHCLFGLANALQTPSR